MQMQQFREATIQQALQAARTALGPDALVLSTEQVVARGWRGWLGRREIQIDGGPARRLTTLAR
jgi:flagellar biosynthesis GTPase FlhF